MSQSRAFILKQVATLTKLGISASDIERSINFVDAHLPPDADPATWVPSAADLSDDLSTEAAVVDARANWYLKAPRKYRRLLDAREID
jgi:hypothetical protein